MTVYLVPLLHWVPELHGSNLQRSLPHFNCQLTFPWLEFSPSAAATAAKSLQSCLTLCDPIDGSPPGSPVLGILQARTLEWVAISFSNAWKWKVKVKSLSPTLRDPMDCRLPGSSIHGILQGRVLEWGAIAFSIWEATVCLFNTEFTHVCHTLLHNLLDN